jgi:hypothetical protein
MAFIPVVFGPLSVIDKRTSVYLVKEQDAIETRKYF